MKVKTDPLSRHQDHLALIEGMIADTNAAISQHQKNIRQKVAEGVDITAEANALRAHAEALKRLQADRVATMKQISRHTKT
jgi:hypothetical protein